MSDQFKLNEDDKYVINIAISYARKFLRRFSISPQEIVGLGHALYALERLPKSTPGIHCSFGVWFKDGNEDYLESKYFDFMIFESRFEVSIGGSVYEAGVGSDHYDEGNWNIEINGHTERQLEIYRLEETIDEYLNLGAEITVNDESEIDWED